MEREIEVHHFPLVIGRSKGSDICLNDRWVSRCHCELRLQDGVLVVRDLGSKHGTMVNDEPVVEAPLLPGDRLSVGLSSFVASYTPVPGSALPVDDYERAVGGDSV